MRIIKIQLDIDVLRRARALPAALLDQVENYFLQLRNELDEEEKFCLDRHGYFVVLEAGDNFFDLSNAD